MHDFYSDAPAWGDDGVKPPSKDSKATVLKTIHVRNARVIHVNEKMPNIEMLNLVAHSLLLTISLITWTAKFGNSFTFRYSGSDKDSRSNALTCLSI